MWNAFLVAKRCHDRPSNVLGIEGDTYAAYCLDEAVIEFGVWVESKIDAVDAKSAKQREALAENALRKCLGMEQKFRSIITGK